MKSLRLGARLHTSNHSSEQWISALERCRSALQLADRIGAWCAVNTAGADGAKWNGPDPDDLTDAMDVPRFARQLPRPDQGRRPCRVRRPYRYRQLDQQPAPDLLSPRIHQGMLSEARTLYPQYPRQGFHPAGRPDHPHRRASAGPRNLRLHGNLRETMPVLFEDPKPDCWPDYTANYVRVVLPRDSEVTQDLPNRLLDIRLEAIEADFVRGTPVVV